MKMKLQYLAAFAALFSAVPAQADELPILKIVRTIMVNTPATEGKLLVPTPLVPISKNGANMVTTINGAWKAWFELPSAPGVPVNLTGFKAPILEHEIYRNDASLDMDPVTPGHQPVVRAGSYNPLGGTNKPDMFTRNAAGVQTSVDETPVRTTEVPVVASFLLIDQVINIGVGNRPKLQSVGDKYGFVRRMTFVATYSGVERTYVIDPSKTYTEVKVWNEAKDLFASIVPSSVPLLGMFQASDDLAVWHTIPFDKLDYPDPIPVTWPKTFQEFTLWYGLDQNFGGNLANSWRRFYRIKEVPVAP
jgi:hypothetical protein